MLSGCRRADRVTNPLHGGALMTHELVDAAEIERSMRAILAPGQVTEVRILDATFGNSDYACTLSGYFDDAAALAGAVGEKPIAAAKGFYFIPNEMNPALLAR